MRKGIVIVLIVIIGFLFGYSDFMINNGEINFLKVLSKSISYMILFFIMFVVGQVSTGVKIISGVIRGITFTLVYFLFYSIGALLTKY